MDDVCSLHGSICCVYLIINSLLYRCLLFLCLCPPPHHYHPYFCFVDPVACINSSFFCSFFPIHTGATTVVFSVAKTILSSEGNGWTIVRGHKFWEKRHCQCVTGLRPRSASPRSLPPTLRISLPHWYLPSHQHQGRLPSICPH